MTRVSLTLAILGLSAAAAATEGVHELGKHGARLELGSSWTRQKFSRDLGDDQFVCQEGRGLFASPNQVFMVVWEIEGVVESASDCRAVLADMVRLGHAANVKFSRNGDHLRATRRFEGEVNGIDFVYRLELLASDGLSYLFMAWSPRSQGEFLDEKVAEVVRGFQFPGLGSEWDRERWAVEYRVSVAGFDLVMFHRPFVLRECPPVESQLVHLESPDGNHAVFAFELRQSSADEVLDASFDACRDGDEHFVEVTRRDIELGGGVTGRLLVARDETLTYHLLALPLDEDRYLDVRYASSGSPETKRRDRDIFFERLRLESAPEVIDLPDMDMPVPRTAIEGHQARLFDVARLLADTTLPQVIDFLPAGERAWVVVGPSAAVRIAPGEDPDTVARLERWGCRLARWQERWLVASPEGLVQEARDGVLLAPESFTARCAAPIGDDLLLVREAATVPVLGLSSNSRMGTDLVVRRTMGGAEQVICSIADVKATQLVVEASGERALLIAEHRPGPSTIPWHMGARCLEVNLGNGAVRDVGEWSHLQHIATAEGGWLVTGRPVGAPSGVYHVSAPQEIVPVVTGQRTMGLEMAHGQLIFASDLLARAPGQPFEIFEVSLAEIRECGALVQPFSTRTINEIARAVIEPDSSSTAPDSASAIHHIVTRANAVARDVVGSDLPATGPGLDALIAEVYDTSRELEPAGRILLAILTTAVNLEQGALWVESKSEAASWLDWLNGPGMPEATAFAVAHTPATLLVSTLDDSEGAWNPGTSLLAGARGRILLFGLDAAALQERIVAACPADLDRTLGSPRPDSVIALLESTPENVFFREQAYEHLAAHGHASVVEQAARKFASRPDADVVDVRAWLAAWNVRANRPEEAAELAAVALTRFHEHPSDAMLCLILGAAYERARPQEPDYARACYQRVRRIREWGPIGDAAQEGLERLRGR